MEEKTDLTALDWVLGEIAESLNQSQQALEAYMANADDATQLRFCLTHLHQVYGSLQMIELEAPAMLAGEMERLTQEMLDGAVTTEESVAKLLMRAIVQLPLYLQQIKREQKFHSASVYPLVNELRSARGDSLIIDAVGFNPKLDMLQQSSGMAPKLVKQPDHFLQVAKKLQQMFQFAAASALRGIDLKQNREYLKKVFLRLKSISQASPRLAQWQIAEAWLDGIDNEELSGGLAVRALMRHLHRDIKLLSQQGIKALAVPASNELLRTLLFYVACSSAESEAIALVKQRYRLDQAFGEPGHKGFGELAEPEFDTVASVTKALKEELDEIKQTLEKFSGNSTDYSSLEEVLPVFQRVADTMTVMGINELPERIKAVGAELKQGLNRATLKPAQLMPMAEQILQLEQQLEAIAASGRLQNKVDQQTLNALRINDAQQAVVAEAYLGLEQVKQSIVDYLSSQWESEHLAGTPALLKEIAGGLGIIPLQRAANILYTAACYVEDKLLSGDAGAPQWVELDTLADTISSVEYYLEMLKSSIASTDDNQLQMAEDSLAKLGYNVAELQHVSSEQAAAPEAANFGGTAAPLLSVVETEPTPAAQVSEVNPQCSPEPEPVAEAQPEDDEVDEEIREIFIEEAGEVIEAIGEYFPRWAADFNDSEALAEFRRAFHTLKGSGRLVKAEQIGELAWSVENMLNRVMDGAIEANQQQASLIQQVQALLPAMVEAFADGRQAEPAEEIAQLQAWAGQLAQNQTPEAMLAAVTEAGTAAPVAGETEIDEELEEQYQLWDIFVSEAESHLAVVKSFTDRQCAVAPLFEAPPDPFQRALHTLKGSAHMAAVTEVAEIATPLEGLAKEMRNYQVVLNQDSLQLFIDAHDRIKAALAQINAREPIVIEDKELLLARVAEQYDLNVGHLIHQEQDSPLGFADPAKLVAFMAEGMDLLLDADRLMVSWRSGAPKPDVAAIRAELQALHRAAEEARLPQVAQISAQLEKVYLAIPAQSETIDSAICQHLESGHEKILDMLDAVAATQELPEAGEALLNTLATDAQQLATEAEAPAAEIEAPAAEIEALTAVSEEPAAEPEQAGAQTAVETDEAGAETLARLAEVEQLSQVEVPAAIAAPEAELEQPQAQDADATDVTAETLERDEDLDPEILAIFYEEADEHIEEIEEAVHQWEETPGQTQHADELKRILHTLKGGARLAGLMGLGQLAHDFETYLIHQGDSAAKDPSFFERVHSFQDRVIRGIKASPGQAPAKEPEAAPALEVAEPEAPTEVATIDAEQVQMRTQAPVQGENTPLHVQRSMPQEVIKVPADLIEDLVNLAGETSISRGRMEQQVSDWSGSIDEMNATILRLQEQLRRLDIETEAQILFRQEQLQQHEDFDPLEMDRYSQLQQLSRSLAESASDLMDLKNTLGDSARDAEQLLLQQSRINTDLQEGLMRSRMVPFSRMVPRLRRIVRQVSTELGKHVNLQMENVEGELDRSVLERMVTPLEHMLRNAVDHGIESAAERSAKGKPSEGRIVISLSREGGDVLLRLADDGRGISLDKVKAKAIERGMMSPDANLSDREIMQFVVQAGFTTAESVTQISGRGVGLDVVSSEIKQLGGSVTINSQEGQGTEFLVRLPFTVSVNRALMVQIGDDSYALPLNTIEGIVRVSPFELEHYYQDPQSRFEYAGENYKVRYLGEMLGTGAQPKLEDQILPLPVVLVRTSEHVVAIQVDTLMGSREIVVKSLGPQFAGVQGLSGATVMGDGSVVVIIDPVALIRRQEALSYQPQLLPEQASASLDSDEITVMVVDDSVTVRKVSSRFLERQGYRVITAKDGMEALKVLQDEIPAIMLLDIEMPRMDGFEVAKNVRSSRRLQDLPIIMITSRTGEKHRDRAMELGVNRYMGKPYQEEALLENINDLIGVVPRAQEQQA